MGNLAEIKTNANDSKVEDFINGLKDEQQRKDSLRLVKLMQKVSKVKPKMWGASLIGFGNKRYKSPKTGREVDWFKIGFSPRKANLSLHLVLDLQAHAVSLKKLGNHKTEVGCLYINRLSEVDLDMLREMIEASAKKQRKLNENE